MNKNDGMKKDEGLLIMTKKAVNGDRGKEGHFSNSVNLQTTSSMLATGVNEERQKKSVVLHVQESACRDVCQEALTHKV
jgi:hypothetical protein